MVLHGSSTLKWAQTQLCSWVQQLQRLSTLVLLVLYSLVLSYLLVKRAQMQVGGLHILQPPSIKSRVLLRSGIQAYPFTFHIT